MDNVAYANSEAAVRSTREPAEDGVRAQLDNISIGLEQLEKVLSIHTEKLQPFMKSEQLADVKDPGRDVDFVNRAPVAAELAAHNARLRSLTRMLNELTDRIHI